ncbi:hypothetical protein KV102_05590 [Mumia sp. zg.B53]|uniref:FlgD immunoglobulin-like domain containing protein n=1 Tax=Mumia sp. zg.B53 TaxID=2855449 RepID=UPI001C6E3765|nr:FlgD immunoglobulin-like domain containing protein [Mumia sp. zg.B53]MBW9214310.1 hypothetical protein [Mumia sp. zg.B53]
MRRALVPALALALVPLASLPAPAVAGPATPGVVTPTSGPAAFSFEVPEAMTAVLLEIRRVGSSAVVASTDLGDLAAGTTSATWDARTTAGTAVADGSYVATLRASDAATPLADESTVRVNLVAPKSAAAPAVSATSVFPWNDGYRDAITLTGVTPTTETPASAAVQVLNASGAVVWSAAGRTARWAGRSSVGAIVPAGTYRVRSRYVDADGLVGYSAPRAVTVSAKRLVTRKVTERISPKAFLYYPYVGRCGKIVKPARKGKAWKKSISVSSNHRCKSKPSRSGTEARFSVGMRGAYDYSAITFKAVGAGHTKARKNAAVGFGITSDWNDISRVRRLKPAYGTRTVFSAHGRNLQRFVDSHGFITFGIATFEGGRYDVKWLRVTATYRTLVDPTARGARVAGGPASQARR